MFDGRSVIVGRAEELRELDAGLDAATRGSGRLFAITGEPGIGKTRLADEATLRAKEKGFTVHWARCWEVGGAPAFWPWIQIFRSLGRDPDTNRAVAAYGDVLSRLLRRALGTASSRVGAQATDDRTRRPSRC
jgi:predicted ATPase